MLQIYLSIFGHATVSLDDSVYIIGGFTEKEGPNTKTIGKFFSGDWFQVGQLNEGRHSHNALATETEIMIVGGVGER